MSEDVTYTEVKFKKPKTKGEVSSSNETTYAEVNFSKSRLPVDVKNSSTRLPEVSVFTPCAAASANGGQRPAEPGRRSKVTSQLVVLLVLSVLLCATAVPLGLLFFRNAEMGKNITSVDLAQNLTDETYLRCDEGWEQHAGWCYSFNTMLLSWMGARDECRQKGGYLVKIDSREEQEFLEKRLREEMKEPEDKFWIGLTDSEEEGRWLWVDGSPLNESLTFWSQKEPDNWNDESHEGEDCVRMGEKGGALELKCWFDKSCKLPHKSICEKAPRVLTSSSV
ncbi:unnamed protein product [Menidia menidia]|uniref:(Atlantic silverside) hypothetical protein n=1 Tax=Menidia menidia TaxID=238744 RepID=A0A8S4ALP4_9TELE|nr:unnamed protein product [Menidia menidia]